LLNTATATR